MKLASHSDLTLASFLSGHAGSIASCCLHDPTPHGIVWLSGTSMDFLLGKARAKSTEATTGKTPESPGIRLAMGPPATERHLQGREGDMIKLKNKDATIYRLKTSVTIGFAENSEGEN